MPRLIFLQYGPSSRCRRIPNEFVDVPLMMGLTRSASGFVSSGYTGSEITRAVDFWVTGSGWTVLLPPVNTRPRLVQASFTARKARNHFDKYGTNPCDFVGNR